MYQGMLGKKSKPVIGMLTGSLVSSNRSGVVVGSSNVQLRSKTQSPKGVKGFDFGGVGLGIVAALEKKGDDPSEILANKALFIRSNPIPVSVPKNSSGIGGDLEEMESSEEYTIVTSHGPTKSYTKVYFDGVEHGRKSDDDDDRRTSFRIQSSIKNDRGSVFHISPTEVAGSPASDFLSSCNMCKKQLHGKDIYMYREKAFCSAECRCRQIAKDERKEKCRLKTSRAVDASSSNGQFFTTGILAI